MKPLSILVVEDDAMIGAVLAEMLAGLGHEIGTIQATGKGAVVAAARHKPDLMIVGLLAAEITARTGTNPAAAYERIAHDLGQSWYERIDAPATAAERMQSKALTPEGIGIAALAGEKMRTTITAAPGDGAPIGGVKVVADNGWFAARPSGTEDIFKNYAESFRSEAHLREIQQGARDALAHVSRKPAPAGLAA